MSPYLYRESMSIPSVQVYTMSLCLYHDSMGIPWVHAYTISPCLYHESMSITLVLVNSMRPCLYHESLPITWFNVYTMSPEIQITEIQKWNLQKNCRKKTNERNNCFRNTEIFITGKQINQLKIYRNTNKRNKKFKFEIYRNTNYRSTEIHIAEVQKYKLHYYRNTSDFFVCYYKWIGIRGSYEL